VRTPPELALEAGQSLRIAGHFVRQKLECDETVKASVFGFEHDAHTATAELFENAVVRNGLAVHRPESYVDETLAVNQSRQVVMFFPRGDPEWNSPLFTYSTLYLAVGRLYESWDLFEMPHAAGATIR
jgi:hypothetical protein